MEGGREREREVRRKEEGGRERKRGREGGKGGKKMEGGSEGGMARAERAIVIENLT